MLVEVCTANKMMAEIETLNTPSVKILKSLLDNDAKVSFHMCGVGGGKVNEDGVLVVDDSFKLIQIYAAE